MIGRRPAAALLAASTTDFPAAPATAAPVSASGRAATGDGGRRTISTRNFYLGLTGVALVIAALSLLIPSTPSYDPWSWIVWGREIIHGTLTITTGGTSWKPLPMIFTIPFALFGKAAPDLWLVIARAGAIAAVVMVFRLAYRLTRHVSGLFGDAGPEVGRLTEIAPALLAGAVGAVALALSASGGFVSSNALGYSEAFATALLLISIERLLDGRPRQAFVVGFFVALDRPEIWLFWGPLGLWLLWKDPGARVLVVASAILVLAAWFVPVKLGCGSFGCSVSRAVHPRSNSLAFASDPFEAELSQAAWPTMLLRVKVVAALLVAAVAIILWRARRREGDAALRSPANRARTITALLGVGGLAWFVVIAAMTQVGFSGNNRYLVLGAALVDICAAVGFGWAAREIAVLGPRLIGRARHPGIGGPGADSRPAVGGPGADSRPAVGDPGADSRPAVGDPGADSRPAVGDPGADSRPAVGDPGADSRPGVGGALQWPAVALLALVFAFGPNWIGSNLVSIPRTHGALVYQAHLRTGLSELVARFGGARRVLACGTVMTEGFQVPMVAWALDVPTTRVEAPPASPQDGGAPPNVILQTRDTRSASLLPFLSSWPTVAYHYVGTAGPIHMFTHDCSGAAS